MITLEEVEKRLQAAGLTNKFWSKPEVRELQHIIMPEETIMHAVSGRHEAGFALLVATDRRLLLVDKKLISLVVEDIRYEMVAEVDFAVQLFEARIAVMTINKSLKFSSLRQSNLRSLTSYVQQQVMELRHYANHMPAQAPFAPRPADEFLVPGASQLINPAAPRQSGSAYPVPQVTVRRRISRFYPTQ